MRGIKFLLAVTALCFVAAASVQDAAASPGWWNSTFEARRCFDINNSNTTTTLNNYTMWLNLSYQTLMNANFSYIAFVESSTGYEVPYFIRSKADSAYANIMLKANLNNSLCVYWGSTKTHERQDVNNTYNSTVAAAWLFNETAGTTMQSYINDSISCTAANATLNLPGKYGPAINLTGIYDNYCVTPNSSTIINRTNYTIEMWINPSRTLDASWDGNGDYSVLLDHQAINGSGFFSMWFSGGVFYYAVCSPDDITPLEVSQCGNPNGQTTTITSITGSAWHHIALTNNLSKYNVGATYLYYDGALSHTSTDAGDKNGTLYQLSAFNSAWNYYFGDAYARSGQFMGLIGDVIMQNEVSNPDYFKARYYGTEETWSAAQGTPTDPTTLSPANNTNMTVPYQLLSCSGATVPGDAVVGYLFWTSSDGATYTLGQNSTATTYNWTTLTSQRTYFWKCQGQGQTIGLTSSNTTERYLNRQTVMMTFQAKSESGATLLDNITLIFTNSTIINVSGPSGANYNLNFTADDTSAGTNVKVEFGQNASLYRNRTMYFNLPAAANTTYTAYLPANSTAVLATFGVQDRQSVAKPSVIVRANKTIGASVYTVGEGLTDGTGVTSMYLTSGEAYDIYAVYGGVTYHHGIIYAATDTYIITINSSSIINMTDVLLNDITICVDPNNVTINTSNTTWYVNFTYNVTSIDPKLSLYGAGLYCNGTTLLGMVNSTTTAYGGLIYVYANVYGCTYVTWQYWLQNSYAGYYGTYLNLTTTTTYGLGLEEAFHLLSELPKAVKDLIAVLILTITAVGLSAFNVEAASVGTLVIGAMLVYAGVLSWGVYLVTFIGALAVIFIRRRY